MRKYSQKQIANSPCVEVAGFRYDHNDVVDKLRLQNKEAFDLLKIIKEKINNNAGENVNWGNVGNMKYVLEQLKNINDFLK